MISRDTISDTKGLFLDKIYKNLMSLTIRAKIQSQLTTQKKKKHQKRFNQQEIMSS